jgi:hypothetical protein
MDGTAFTNPSSGKIDQQRKILEDLERQKKLLKAGTTPSLGILPLTPSSPAVVGDTGHITSGQRSALESANKTSFGFFIPQDSSFGNIILPVIPRLQPKNPAK